MDSPPWRSASREVCPSWAQTSETLEILSDPQLMRRIRRADAEIDRGRSQPLTKVVGMAPIVQRVVRTAAPQRTPPPGGSGAHPSAVRASCISEVCELLLAMIHAPVAASPPGLAGILDALEGSLTLPRSCC